MARETREPLRRSRINRGDDITIERTDSRRVHGTFVRENAAYVTVRGTVGDAIGREILVPVDKIMGIEVVGRAER